MVKFLFCETPVECQIWLRPISHFKTPLLVTLMLRSRFAVRYVWNGLAHNQVSPVYFTNVATFFAENCRFTNCLSTGIATEISLSFVLRRFVLVCSTCRDFHWIQFSFFFNLEILFPVLVKRKAERFVFVLVLVARISMVSSVGRWSGGLLTWATPAAISHIRRATVGPPSVGLMMARVQCARLTECCRPPTRPLTTASRHYGHRIRAPANDDSVLALHRPMRQGHGKS